MHFVDVCRGFIERPLHAHNNEVKGREHKLASQLAMKFYVAESYANGMLE